MSDLIKLDIMSDGTIGLNETRITRSKMYGIQTVEKSVLVSQKAIIEALGIEKEIYAKGYSDGYVKAIYEFAERFIYKAVCEGCSGCCNCYEEEKQSECEDWKAYMKIAEEIRGAE